MKTNAPKWIELGQHCAVDITGIIEDGPEVTTEALAYAAICAALQLGRIGHNRLNNLTVAATAALATIESKWPEAEMPAARNLLRAALGLTPRGTT